MPLETATYISQLVSSNPAGTDSESQGDDHLRLIKGCILSTFPNFTAVALNSSQAAIDAAVAAVTGTANLVMKAGTVSAPGLGVAGNTNTGLYQSASGHLNVAINGAVSLDMSSTGHSVTGTLSATGALSGASLSTGSGAVTCGPITSGNVAATGTLSATGAISGGTGQLVPTGGTMVWWTSTAPTGYLFCNGQSLSTTTYAALFAVIGYAYGGSGANFNLPDLREAVPIGGDMGAGSNGRSTGSSFSLATLGSYIGEWLHTLVTGEMPAHNHSATSTDSGHTHASSWTNVNLNITGGGGGAGPQPDTTYNSGHSQAPTNSASANITTTIGNQGGGSSHNNLGPSIVCNWIIKT